MKFFVREKHNFLPTLITISFVVFVLSLVYLGYNTLSEKPSYPDRAKGDGLIVSNAFVKKVKVLVTQSNPVQVNVVAIGTLPDPCTMVDEIVQYKNENTFFVIIRSSKPHDAVCTENTKEFEEIIPLDVTKLQQGLYKVNVNGIEDSFEF